MSEPFLAAKLMVIIQKAKPSFSTTAAIGTGVPSVSQDPTKGPSCSQEPAMGAKSHERTPTKRRRTSAVFFGAMATPLLKDGSTSFPVPGGMTGAHRRGTRNTRMLSSTTSSLTKTRPRQAS